MRFRALSLVCLCVSLLFCAISSARQSPAMQAAAELFNQSKWPEAAKAYADITARDPKNGAAWMNLGESLLQLHKPDAAADAFQRAIQAGFRPVLNQVNVARASADAHDRAKVLSMLQQVVDSGNGGRMRPIILSSTEFSAMADDPDFQRLLDKMRPCTTEEYRQFDFWLGDWDVQVQGQTAGHNLVSLEQDGCLLVEHWKASTGGQTGTSFNYYDVRDKKWHQLYLDNSGNAGAFPAMAGRLVGDKMVLVTDPHVNPVSRWTWYVVSPGKVRQMAEQSTDGQKTWNITWDSIYVKITPN
jgi:tetratricopeptide (TPR) repeat protein